MRLSKVGNRKVVTLGKDASLEEAARMMREHHVGDVVVVENRQGRKFPVGILTDRDIVTAAVALSVPTGTLTAGDIMAPELTTVAENWGLTAVIEIMKAKGIKRIPVVGKEGELSGIISLEDVMELLASELTALAEVSGRQRVAELSRRGKLA